LDEFLGIFGILEEFSDFFGLTEKFVKFDLAVLKIGIREEFWLFLGFLRFFENIIKNLRIFLN
jgi:hypothetical protein